MFLKLAKIRQLVVMLVMPGSPDGSAKFGINKDIKLTVHITYILHNPHLIISYIS